MTVLREAVRPRVLIVDDSEDARALLQIKMQAHGGYDVVGEALEGRDAVRLAGELQPEIVLLDIAMPGMDGLEALPLIRAAAPEARIVVLTVFQTGRLSEEILAAGADRYVVKGGAMRDLMGVLDSVLEDR